MFEHPQEPFPLQHGEVSKPEQPGHPEGAHAHAPLTQLSPLVQAWVEPHPPQLFRSVCSFTHAPLQAV
jgi:hypothetical protein